ncbi:hypothetical protein [Flavobacterium sp.]|uniref:hypothetical protein n=1 Tax=Flavobacterium sp. TaxID=239 RepID=UPI004047CF72
MKKHTILFLLFLIGFNQSEAFSKIECNQTPDKYINIPGTRLLIIPPKGFVISKKITGLEKENAIIQVMDLIGGNYYKNSATFTKSKFENKGIKVIEFKEIKIAGFKAKYAHIEGGDGTQAINLVFGDTSFSTVILAPLGSSNIGLASEIKNAILKVKYDKTITIDPLASSFFKINSNDSKFKFAKSTANLFIYSENGIVKDPYKDEPMVIITTLPKDGTTSKEMMIKSMIDGLVQNGFSIKEEKKPIIGKINGFESIEVEYIAEQKGKTKLIYLTVISNTDTSIAFYGITESDFENNLEEFIKLSHSLRFK